EELLRKIVVLEEENRELHKTIIEQQQESLVSRISRLLETEVTIRYKYKTTSGNITDDAVSVSGLKLGQFLIPRLNREALILSPAYPKIVSTEVMFSALISEFVIDLTKNQVESIEPESMDDIISILSGFGLLSVTTDGFQNRHVIRTALGRHVIGDELLESFE